MTHKFSICLYQPDMPQNVAVAIRTAACLGFPLHIVKPLNFSISDKRFRGAVMDYINYCDLKYHESWDVFFDFCLKKTFRIIISTTKTKNSYSEFNFTQGDIIVFGKETAGLPENIHSQINYKITIPMIEKIRSLNLATSVAIISSEVNRQLNL
ncbi:MAG: tRNA methyltransferase [Pelagibacteraceae bacterium]|nr:tRNA methyltransferase [Pelagibacteraceae bacterium]|tara:strand:+ start:1278 stop:1739 length:462 start_codon:yes stop_codon:yes gene_type:complete